MDPRDQTFMTIHNLTPDAVILFASDSVLDILGYHPDEVKGKSAFDYFHPDEVPFARSIHSRGVLLDKAAVLHYARILSKSGQWVSCECCFTVVHNVLVASTSIYFRGERSERRARDAPQIRRIFACSPRDPRYHMLEHLSPKFKMPPMEREPRAALILNRFTRNLTIMYATDAVAQILGLRPDELVDRPFYECIQPNCIEEAERCLESAKANESIAYLRFWYKDPRADLNDEANEEEQEADDTDEEADDSSNDSDEEETHIKDSRFGHDGMELDEDEEDRTGHADGHSEWRDEGEDASPSDAPVSRPSRCREQAPQLFELEAVVSCTSDGLVVVLRKARPPIMPAAFNLENGLFAAPWGLQPIEPYISPELLYTFRPPLLPQYMPLRECVKAAGGPPLDQLMRSIRDVAVFAWAVTGINGTLATYGHGQPRIGAQPLDGLPVWEPNPVGRDNSQAAAATRAATAEAPKDPPSTYPCGRETLYQASHTTTPTPTHGYPRTRHASLDEGMYDTGQPSWTATAAPCYHKYYHHDAHQYSSYGSGGEQDPLLRPAFSYDALHGHARRQQAAAGYAAAATAAAAAWSSSTPLLASGARGCSFREEEGRASSSSSSSLRGLRASRLGEGVAERSWGWPPSKGGGDRWR